MVSSSILLSEEVTKKKCTKKCLFRVFAYCMILNLFFQKYYLTLGKQVTKPNKEQHVGSHLSGEFVDYFNDDQAEQLLELHKAIKNPTEGNGGSPS